MYHTFFFYVADVTWPKYKQNIVLIITEKTEINRAVHVPDAMTPNFFVEMSRSS